MVWVLLSPGSAQQPALAGSRAASSGIPLPQGDVFLGCNGVCRVSASQPRRDTEVWAGLATRDRTAEQGIGTSRAQHAQESTGGLPGAHSPNWQMYRFRVLQRWSFQLKAADACISTQFPNLCPTRMG